MVQKIDPDKLVDDETVVQLAEGGVAAVSHHPDQVVCGACLKPFWPVGGKIDVVRTGFDDPGTPACPKCMELLQAQNLVELDSTKFKCRCGTKDPAYLDTNGHPSCPIHTSIPSSARVN